MPQSIRTRVRLGVGAVVLAAVAATGALGASSGMTGPVRGTADRACATVTNVEAIVDDSGSMGGTDRNRLRVAALDLFVSKPENGTKTLGAVEFGSRAASLFQPQAIGRNLASIKSTLTTRITANEGGTNYNDAFELAKAENPNAQARIFLTDGGHNTGTYANGHRNGPPTYVIGLTIGPARPGDAAALRLQQIADETGGRYYPQQNASTLQATVNEINALLDCQQAPNRIVDRFTRQGQTRSHSIGISRGTGFVELTSTWDDPANKFVLTVRGRAGRRVVGATYSVVRIANPRTGELRFTLRASRLRGTASVITQIARAPGSSGGGTSTTAQLRTFVDRIEVALTQSAASRRKLAAALSAGFSCAISTRSAGQRVASVVVERTRTLRQLGSVGTPTSQAGTVRRLLERALQESIAADRYYRDGFFALGPSSCPLPRNAQFRLAATFDRRATAAKQRFVAAFNPLARRFGRRTWSANQI